MNKMFVPLEKLFGPACSSRNAQFVETKANYYVKVHNRPQGIISNFWISSQNHFL